jgi:hypothetical protein
MAVSGRVQGPPQDGDVEQFSQQLGQWILTGNPSLSGAINLTDVNGTTRAQIESVSGDLWLLSNAIWNPNDSTPTGNFYRIDQTHAAFGLQIQGQGYIPGEPNLGYYVAGATFWVAQPESYTVIRGGGQFGNPIFNVVGGWELGSTVTQQRQMTIGGGGIEIDGYSLSPYGRVLNNQTGTVLHKQLVGMVRNAFTDLSGYDDGTQESWYWGFIQEYNTSTFLPVPSSSRWSVAYIPANTSPFSGILYEYLKVTPNGSVATVEVTQNPTTPLGVATKQYVDGDTAWTNVTSFTNGWTASGATPGYILLGREVYLRGAIIPGTANTSAFTLPVGYRPSASGAFLGNNGNATPVYVSIAVNGTVTPLTASTTWLSQISFPNI